MNNVQRYHPPTHGGAWDIVDSWQESTVTQAPQAHRLRLRRLRPPAAVMNVQRGDVWLVDFPFTEGTTSKVRLGLPLTSRL